MKISETTEHAQRIIDHCHERASCYGEAIDRLERFANVRGSDRACPKWFTTRQRNTVQRIVLRAYLHAIGRA